jgi:predicted amidohydrolase
MKIAGVQMDITLGQIDSNVEKMITFLKETTAAGAQLTIFPECAATGYCFESLEEAREYAQPIPGPVTEQMSRACADLNCFAIFGMLEANGIGIFNAAVLTGPDGVVGSYRKIHLPFLGADMFATFGDRPFEVHAAGDLNVGMNICYDSAFPEASRVLAIQGADLIALPTNWPPGAECISENAINTRAMENSVYYAAVNRVGTERGFTFIGRSRICAPNGTTLATGSGSEEEILYAEIDPEKARNKRVVRVPGKHAIDRMADRRPEMYAPLTEPHKLERPGRGERQA